MRIQAFLHRVTGSRSLRQRLVIYFIAASLIPFAAASYLAYRTVQSEAEKSAVREMTALAQSTAKALSVFMNDRFSDLLAWSQQSVIRESIELPSEREAATQMLVELARVYPAYHAILLLNEEKVCVVSSLPALLGRDFSKSPFFTGKADVKVHVSDLHRSDLVADLDPESEGWTLNISVPVKTDEFVVGSVVSFLRWSAVESIVASTTVGKTGYVYMVNGKSELISHPLRDYYLEALDGAKLNLSSLKVAIDNKESSHRYSYSNPKTGRIDDKMVGLAYPEGFGTFEGLGWVLGASAETGDIMAFLPRILRNLGLSAALIALLAVVLSAILARQIAEPVSAIENRVKKISQGDLAIELPLITRRDELGSLATAFGTMVESLISQARETLGGVNVLNQCSAEISGAVLRLSSSASESSEEVLRTNSVVERVKTAAQESSRKVLSMAEHAESASESGIRATDDTLNKMNQIKSAMELIRSTVDNLKAKTEAIGKIIAVVQDLASESHILAVNASIEAALAGERGKGFSVVAAEIKRLSDESKGSTNQVRSILEEIQASVGTVDEAADSAALLVSEGYERSVLAGESIRVLTEAVTKSSREASAIEASGREQVAGLEEISQAIHKVQQAVHVNVDSAKQLDLAASKLKSLGSQLRGVAERYHLEA